jgi:hypothetical protein
MPPPSAASLEVAPLDDPFCSSSISTNLACLAGIRARLRKLRRTSAPRLPQAVQTKPGSMSDSLM